MLQESRNSIDVEKYVRKIEKLEEYARRIAVDIKNSIQGLNELIIAYHRHGYLPASLHYWMKTTLTSWKKTLLVEASTLTYYIAAYSEPTNIIYYTTNPRSASTIHLLQATSLTGHRVLVYTIKPLDERLRELLEQYNPYYISVNDELEASLIYALAVYHALAEEYRDAMSRRSERLYKHSREGFSIIVDELLTKYKDIINAVTSIKDRLIITSTKILEPICLYYVEALRRKGIKTYYTPLDHIEEPGNVLLLTISVEEYLVKEKKFKLFMKGGKIHELTINTDPLEALIYHSLIAYYIALK